MTPEGEEKSYTFFKTGLLHSPDVISSLNLLVKQLFTKKINLKCTNKIKQGENNIIVHLRIIKADHAKY